MRSEDAHGVSGRHCEALAQEEQREGEGLTLPHPHRRILTPSGQHRPLRMPIQPHNFTIRRQIRQKLPIPPILRLLLSLRGATLPPPPNPHFPIHPTGGNHLPIRGELDVDNGILVARQQDRLERITVEREVGGEWVVGWHRREGAEDVGVVVFSSGDCQWRVREIRVEREREDGSVRGVVCYKPSSIGFAT